MRILVALLNALRNQQPQRADLAVGVHCRRDLLLSNPETVDEELSVLSPSRKKLTSPGSDVAIKRFIEAPLSKPNANPFFGSGIFREVVLRRFSAITRGGLTLIDRKAKYEFGDTTNSELHANANVHDARCCRHLVFGGSLGAAESYLRGYWTCDDLPGLMRILARNASVLSA